VSTNPGENKKAFEKRNNTLSMFLMAKRSSN
jgi:hypothetical protein